MTIIQDCKDCPFSELRREGHYCTVEHISLKADVLGRIKPPSYCHYSGDWKGKRV